MMKLKKGVLFGFVILSLLFAVSSTRLVTSAWASPSGEQTYHTLTLYTVSRDAYIWSMQMDTNFGAEFRLDFGFDNYSSSVYRVLIQFDLPPALSEANITSAKLKPSNYGTWSGGYPGGEVLRVCRVTHDWVEGTGNGTAPTQDGVTWNEYDYDDGLATATNDWGTPGGDYTLTDSSTFTVPADPPWGATSWAVTDIVKGWANGTYSNSGFLIKLDNESGAYKGGVFDSKEYAEEYAYGGTTLEITYAVPTVESCSLLGDRKDYFELGETLCVNGTGFSHSTVYSFYIVMNQENWTDGMPIPERVPDTNSSITSNANGDVDLTDVWHDPQTVGSYDIVVDVNGNGQYDAYVDALDDGDVEVTAGFSVIPEYSSILLLFMTAAPLTLTVLRRRTADCRRKHSV